MSMPMPELCLSYAGMAQLPQGPRRPSSGQRSAHPLPSWPFTSCPPSSRLSALSALTLLTLISRCLFTPLPRRLASSPFLSVPSVSVIFSISAVVSVSVPPDRDVAVALVRSLL